VLKRAKRARLGHPRPARSANQAEDREEEQFAPKFEGLNMQTNDLFDLFYRSRISVSSVKTIDLLAKFALHLATNLNAIYNSSGERAAESCVLGLCSDRLLLLFSALLDAS
jgi:hypothetical protein